MLVLKNMLNLNFELLSIGILLTCIGLSVFSETNANPVNSCEKLKFSPVLQVFKNKTTQQFDLYNIRIQQDGKTVTSKLIRDTVEDLLVDSVNNDVEVSCTCRNPCRITCCSSGQSSPNISATYDFISSEEYENFDKSKGKKPCVKNYRNEGYFTPLSFHPSTSAFDDFNKSFVYKPPLNVRDRENVMIYTSDLNFFCDDRKSSLENMYDYYLIKDSALLRRPKTNSSLLFELVLTKNYCTVPYSSPESFFEICGNHYSLYLEKNSRELSVNSSAKGAHSSAKRAQVATILRFDGVVRTNPLYVLVSLPFLIVAVLLQGF